MRGQPLSDTHPELAAQAVAWDPSTVSSGSEKVRLWRCPAGHEWRAMVKVRVYGRECPVCRNRAVLPGYNDLATTHPELAAQAVGWDPTTVTAGSARRVGWLCELGHQWVASIAHRTERGDGCPFCGGKRALAGYNDLATTHPELAAQAVDWDPTTLTRGSHRVERWRCSVGHEWTASPNARSRGSGCPYCSNEAVLPGYNDLATTHPELATQAVGWDPTTLTYGSPRKMAWLCSEGHTWSAAVGQRAGKERTGCPYCAGQAVLPGYNDLATKFPDIAAQAVGWDPTTVTAFSKLIRKWRCPIGHEYNSAVGNRTGPGQGCPYCSGNRVLAGFNDLATKFPDIATQAIGWDPTTVTAGTNSKRAWWCSQGHEYVMVVGNRTGQGQGCPYCAGRSVLVGYNDLATVRPDLAAQAAGWDPTAVVLNSNRKVMWRCELGHQWRTSPNARATNNTGCPYCSGNRVLASYNDLATVRPDIASQAVGWDTTTVTAGSKVKRRWRCPEGHEWVASVGSRTGLNAGCPTCSKSGFDPSKPGYLYYLEHDLWGLLQIGISNVPRKRVGQHQAAGWSVIEVRGPMDGAQAHAWEQSILRALRRRGAALAPSNISGKFTGYTEAWVAESYPARSLNELMDLVRDDEEVAPRPS